MLFKNKKTGVTWDISEDSPAHKRVLANPNDYEPVVEKCKKEKE